MKKNVDGHIQASPMPRELKKIVLKSDLRYINCYLKPLELNYVNRKGEKFSIILVKTPAWNTQRTEVDIAYSIGMLKAITKAKTVRLVFIINQKKMC